MSWRSAGIYSALYLQKHLAKNVIIWIWAKGKDPEELNMLDWCLISVELETFLKHATQTITLWLRGKPSNYM